MVTSREAMILIEWCIQPLRFEQREALSFPGEGTVGRYTAQALWTNQIEQGPKVLASAAHLGKEGSGCWLTQQP